MRLRYLHIQNLSPLDDIAATFGYESILGRKCAIRFVVGVNGSGKTRLLQALCEVFLNLENQALPPFPVTLAYDLGTEDNTRTIFLHHPGTAPSNAVFLDFPAALPMQTDWEQLAAIALADWQNRTVQLEGVDPPTVYSGDNLPGIGSIESFLPQVLLAYSSGAIETCETWASLFTPQAPNFTDLINTALEQTDSDQERPPNWDMVQELSHLRQEGLEPTEEENTPSQDELITSPEDLRTRSIGLYVSPQSLKLAFFAVALHQARKDFSEMPTESDEQTWRDRIEQSIRDNEPMPGLRGLLNKVDWLWLVSVNMQVQFQLDRLTQRQSSDLASLYRIATSVIRPSAVGDQRQLIFDLRQTLPDQPDTDTTTCAALIRVLCGRPDEDIDRITPFDTFKQLLTWQREGWLQDLTMTLRKRNVEDVLLYDWLSDGERVFLGRMALFQLLAGENDALVILDEPETHFNDVWKREIVDVIDSSLRDNTTEVMISTHSSIALTDVFDTEITLLYKDTSDGSVAIIKPRIPTFGASPNEVMIDVFGASESVGQRATEFLDLVLMLAAHPNQVETVWAMNGDRAAVQESLEFQQLRGFMQGLPHQYGNAEDFDVQLLNTLHSIHHYAEQIRPNQNIRVTDTLELLQEKLGPGYYQFEFRRRLRALRERDISAS